MKRWLSVLLATVLMVTAVIPALSVSAAGEVDGEQYEVKTLTTYLYSKDKPSATDALFTKELPTIPYLDAEDFFGHIYTPDFTTAKNPDGTYSITSKTGGRIRSLDLSKLRYINRRGHLVGDPFGIILPYTVEREGGCRSFLQQRLQISLRAFIEAGQHLGDELIRLSKAAHHP